MMANAPTNEDRVLPTLNTDGTRRWIRPRLFRGRFWKSRAVVGWALIVTFVGLPFLKVGGHPAMLLDVLNRRFYLFGAVFRPTDGVLLMLLMLSIFVSVFLFTALFGRVWCGWACPQTVYMEFLYRPIERLFEGGYQKQMKLDKSGPNARRVAKNVVFGLVSIVLGNVFLSYFVGVQQLWTWMRQSPLEHPGGFAVMAITAGLVMFDFAYFREQMCTVICPYARFQSALLDKKSLIVAYDEKRGEPRGKPGKVDGDCVDCTACVQACPTGIDIREGLQLECIACTQCIDACDGIMDKLKRPRGLIRYTSQDALESGSSKLGLMRARVVIYPLILAALVSGLIIVGGGRGNAELTVLRGLGAPYVVQPDGTVRNQVRIKLENRSGSEHAYRIELLDADSLQLVAPENPLDVKAGEQRTTSVFVLVPNAEFQNGKRAVRFRVSDGEGYVKEASYTLLGPGVRGGS